MCILNLSDLMKELDSHVILHDILDLYRSGEWWRVWAFTTLLALPGAVALAVITRFLVRFW